jgi:hypothetical protein
MARQKSFGVGDMENIRAWQYDGDDKAGGIW